MLELILEKPWLVGIFGSVLTAVAAQWWLSSGRREAMLVAVGTLVITLILAMFGVWIETEQEVLRVMLYRTADDLQNNRKNEVLAAIYETPSASVVEARQLLRDREYTFEVSAIKKLHSIEISGPASARRALVKMNVFVEGQFGGHSAKVPRYVEVTLYRVDDRWLVFDFKHDQPFAGFQAQ